MKSRPYVAGTTSLAEAPDATAQRRGVNRLAEKREGYVHQETGKGFYTSGPSQDPRAPGGRFISTGDSSGKTSHLYDREGKHVDTSQKGSGGPAANAPPGGKK